MDLLHQEVLKNKDYKYKIQYHNTLGELYYFEGIDQKKSYKEFKIALDILEKNNSSYLADLIYSNYAIALQSEGKLKESLEMKRKALNLTRKNKDFWLESIITNNMAVNFLYLQEPDSAAKYFEYSYRIALKTTSQTDEVQRAMFLGLFHNDHSNPELALSYFNVALAKINALETYSEKKQLFAGLSRTYELLNQNDQAFECLKKERDYSDSAEYNNIKREAFIYNHELKLEYLKHKNQIEKERNQKFQLQIVISILVIVLLLGTTVILILRNRKNKLLEKYRIENDALEKEKLKIEKIIADREITSKAMFLLEKDNLIHQISNKLKDTLPQVKEENQNILQSVINELKSAVNVKRWEEFEMYFNKVNPAFFDKLNQEFPNLTINERKLCALLSMQMSTKEISNITGQTNHSVNIARGRLRKKLNIDHTDIELVSFLNKYNG